MFTVHYRLRKDTNAAQHNVRAQGEEFHSYGKGLHCTGLSSSFYINIVGLWEVKEGLGRKPFPFPLLPLFFPGVVFWFVGLPSPCLWWADLFQET